MTASDTLSLRTGVRSNVCAKVLPRSRDKNATRSNRCLNLPRSAGTVLANHPRGAVVAKHSPDHPEPAAVREIPDGPADASGLTSRQRLVLEVIRDSVE